MKKIHLSIIIIIIFLAALIFVKSHNDKEQNKIIKSVNKPQRIVSLSANLTEILFGLGVGENVVAVSNESNWPIEAGTKKKTGSFWQPNTEEIISCRPDLVVTLWFEQQKQTAESLKRLGYQVLSLKIETIDELFEAIKKIGAAVGQEEKSNQLAGNIKNELENLKKKFETEKQPKTLWVMQLEPFRVAGTKTFINELIEMAGGKNAVGETVPLYPQINSEEILRCQAEVIIHSAMGSDLDKEQKKAEQFWSKYPSLPAVKDKRIYVVQPDTTLRLGPRLADGLSEIGNYLHLDIKK